MADCECQALALALVPPSSAELDRPCFQARRRRKSWSSPRPLDFTELAETSGPESRDARQRVQDCSRPGRPRWPSRPGDSPTTFRPANSGAIPRPDDRQRCLGPAEGRARCRRVSSTSRRSDDGHEEPVWITGVGLATSLGCDLATLEASLLAGRSGVAVVTSFSHRRLSQPDRGPAARRPLPVGPGPGVSFTPCHGSSRPHSGASRPHSRTPACGTAGATRRIGLVLGIGAEWMELWEADASRGGNRLLDPAQDDESTLERVHRRSDSPDRP